MNKSNNGPVITYRAGQNFPEIPGDRHTLDENASKTEPAKLLAVFVVDTDEESSLPPKQRSSGQPMAERAPSAQDRCARVFRRRASGSSG